MADKTTLFERIKEFVLMGYDNNQIAEYLNISPDSGYIRRVRRAVNREKTKPTETPSKSPLITHKKYYKAMKGNKGSKEELAAELGVARMTLHRFEKSTDANKKLAQYLYLRGTSISRIATLLGTKESTIKEMGLENLPTEDGIKEQIRQVLEVLKDASIFDDEIEAQFYEWQRLYDKIK